MVALLVSRRLAHKLQNQLQVIVGRIEERNAEAAIEACREMSNLINGCLESKDEELARQKREELED